MLLITHVTRFHRRGDPSGFDLVPVHKKGSPFAKSFHKMRLGRPYCVTSVNNLEDWSRMNYSQRLHSGLLGHNCLIQFMNP